MKRVFEIEIDDPEEVISGRNLEQLIRTKFDVNVMCIREVGEHPKTDASTGIKKIFEIEYKKGHQPVVSHEMKSMLASYTTGLVGVKDVSKDVAILRGQEPKPLGWREAGPAPNAEIEKLREHIEQLERQLTVCSIAVNGSTESVAVRGDYAWSDAYQDVIDLRKRYDALKDDMVKSIERGLDRPVWGKSIIETLNEEREKAHRTGVDEAYKNPRIKSSILLSESVELWYCMSEGPTVTFEGFCNDIASAGITIKNDLPGVES